MDTVHECDGRTDGRTDRITITKTVLRIASHGKNAVSVLCLVGVHMNKYRPTLLSGNQGGSKK